MIAKGGHLCSAFYERMKEVREYHRRYPYLEVAEVSSASVLSAFWQSLHGAPVSVPEQETNQMLKLTFCTQPIGSVLPLLHGESRFLPGCAQRLKPP